MTDTLKLYWYSLSGAVSVRESQGFNQSPSDQSWLPGTARDVSKLSSEDPKSIQGEYPNMYE